MSQVNIYYTLISSLPYLPRYDQVDRLPINQERLRERLKMLEPDDAELIGQLTNFLCWDRQPAVCTDAEMIAQYEKMRPFMNQPALAAIIGFRMDLITILAALRRRHLGWGVPPGDQPWAVSRLARHIEQNWEDPTFKLGAGYSWIAPVRDLLAAEETLALDRLIFNLIWDRINQLTTGLDFCLEKLLGYLFKWDVIASWLAYEPRVAEIRFAELVQEVTCEHKIDFK